MTSPLSEPDYDRQHAEEPAGPVCSRCGKRAEVSAEEMVFIPTGETICPTLYACPTDGEFYEDREGFTIRQVFLDDPTHDVIDEAFGRGELDGDEVEF